MKPFGVVYLIWNMVNGRRYVGQTTRRVEERFKEHASCKIMLVGKAIRKHGRENFRYGVIKSCASKEELDYWEIFFIAALKSKSPYGYRSDGGEGGIPCDETRAKMSASQSGDNNPNYGKNRPAVTCAKIGAVTALSKICSLKLTHGNFLIAVSQSVWAYRI